MIQAPIFHVNGDDPEACARAARLAFEYREAFQRDVVVDIVCYRRHGHNEGDDPSYTQPQMYKIIDQLRSVRKIYTETLIRRGDISMDEAEAALNEFNTRLQSVLDEVRTVPKPKLSGVHAAEIRPDLPAPDTGVDVATLMDIAKVTVSAPEGFTIHPKLERQFTQRTRRCSTGEDRLGLWRGLGHRLAGEVRGSNVRLTGQDTRRGTFSHRHAVWLTTRTGTEYVPLASGRSGGASRCVTRCLSEYACSRL
jgi:2-oxoglutarate decarboxylase